MNRTRVVIAAAVVVCLATVTRGQERPRENINEASVVAFRVWIDAVRSHAPGHSDPAVATVAGWSYELREDLNTGMELFLSALMGWRYSTGKNKAAEEIAAMGRASDREFLKRAAVLHSDVAAYGDLFPHPATGGARRLQPRTQELQLGRGGRPERITVLDPPPPLLREDRVLLDKDGQVVGEVISTWNWPFARSLLDVLSGGPVKKLFSDGRPEPATDPFVSAWYHATTAYMFARGLYGDATPHLHHASFVLPEDPLALFDRACYAEILGLPMHQALAPDPDAGHRARGAGDAATWTTPSSTPGVRIPSASKTNSDAEQLFRRAVAIAPSLAEARVRLARLLQVRGRYEEAGAELESALRSNPTSVVAFYAHLFAGRSAEALGPLVEATKHYDEARALFPNAQSALLASSHVAMRQSDVSLTLAPIERLGASSAVFTSDPWWQYHLAAGRDADFLLRAMWGRIPR